MRYRNPIILMLLLYCCSVACKKDSAGYKLCNKTGERIHFELYQDLDDYALGKNAIANGFVEKDKTLDIPLSKLNNAPQLYIDWHNDDLTCSNWRMADNIIQPGIYSINSFPKTYLRQSVLSNNIPSTWKTIDVIGGTGNIYYTSLEITINKVEMQLYRKDTFGNTSIRTVRLSDLGDAVYCDLGSIDDQLFLTGTIPPQPSAYRGASDTITYKNSSVYCVMVKK